MNWGRNFATQPNFITFSLPSVSGEAALPSTVDLFIDGALRQTQSIAPGPFELVDLPVVTGAGTADLVVRDLLGREQVLSTKFYASNALLRAGLTDFGLEAGFIREDFGISSREYGRFVSVGTARHGFNDAFTAEARLEVLDDQATAGIGANWSLPFPGLVTVGLASSHAERGVGQLVLTASP